MVIPSGPEYETGLIMGIGVVRLQQEGGTEFPESIVQIQVFKMQFTKADMKSMIVDTHAPRMTVNRYCLVDITAVPVGFGQFQIQYVRQGVPIQAVVILFYCFGVISDFSVGGSHAPAGNRAMR